MSVVKFNLRTLSKSGARHLMWPIFFYLQQILNLKMETIKGTFSLSHQYINTFYNSYRLHVSAITAIFRPTL